MSDNPVPKPRVDEQSVPACASDCPHVEWSHTLPDQRVCVIDGSRRYTAPGRDLCLPAVRAMARDLAEARAEVNELSRKLVTETYVLQEMELLRDTARAEAMTARRRLEVVGLGVYPYRDGPMRGSSNPKPWEVRMDRPIWGRPEIDDEDLKAVLRKLNLFPTHLAALDAARAALVKAGIIKEEGR